MLFVRVDLHYLSSQEASIDISTMMYHMQYLLSYISNKDSCFKDLQGYAWAIEQGEDRGYHCHLLLIYNGSVNQHDYYYGDEVGKKWQFVTNGMGSYFNCNTTDYKKKFRDEGTLGIGMIHRSNEVEVQNALRVASYLVNPEKSNQTLLVKPINGWRTFGKGQFNVSWRRGISS